MTSQARIKKLKITDHLIGVKLPTNIDGHAGRAIENILEGAGLKVNRGLGPDLIDYGIEVKTRKKSATSAQTITSMSVNDIIKTPYKDSNVYKKFQQQLRIKTDDNNYITEAELFDFDQTQIQELIETAYENGRMILTQNKNIGYTPYTGYWGYFEQTKKDRENTYDFRVSNSDMESLERMAKSNFKHMFEVIE
jgi:homoserine dehydrogenase